MGFWIPLLAEDDIYLAYSDFHPYLIVDASCVKELNQWFVKQLDTVCDHKAVSFIYLVILSSPLFIIDLSFFQDDCFWEKFTYMAIWLGFLIIYALD